MQILRALFRNIRQRQESTNNGLNLSANYPRFLAILQPYSISSLLLAFEDSDKAS